MKVKVGIGLYIFVIVQIQFAISIKCFQCSLLTDVEVHGCPSLTQDVVAWSQDSDHYLFKSNEKGYACVVGVDSSKKVYFQGSLSGFRCEGLSYQNKIVVNINNKSPLKSAELQCCYTDGCNWNITTARSNTSLPEILASQDESLLSASVDWVPIVLICLIVLVIIACVACLICFKNQKRKEKEIKQIPYNIPLPDRNDIPVTPTRNIRSISVSDRDHERYSAVDARLYRRNNDRPFKGINDYKYHTDSSGYSSESTSAYSGADPVTKYTKARIGKVSKDVFDNDDFHKANQSVTDEELRMPRKGKNWNNIWKSATDPNYVEKGTDVNAFRYSSA